MDSFDLRCQFIQNCLIVVECDYTAVVHILGYRDGQSINAAAQDGNMLGSMYRQQRDDRMGIDLIVKRVPTGGGSGCQCRVSVSLRWTYSRRASVSVCHAALFLNGPDRFCQIQRTGVDGHARDGACSADFT